MHVPNKVAAQIEHAMIPKIIHYCWFGPKPMSALNVRCIASWQALMPDYEIVRWDETNSAIDHDYARAAQAQGRWSRLANHVRMQALVAHGGLYLDTDVEVLRRFDPLLDQSCFLGFQQEPADVDWVNNAVIGAVAGHPFLQRALQSLDATFARHQHFPRGPELFTHLLRKNGLQHYGLQQIHDVTLYPCEFFYPRPWYAGDTDDPMLGVSDATYCIHHWEGTWTSRALPAQQTPV